MRSTYERTIRLRSAASSSLEIPSILVTMPGDSESQEWEYWAVVVLMKNRWNGDSATP